MFEKKLMVCSKFMLYYFTTVWVQCDEVLKRVCLYFLNAIYAIAALKHT
jgi:hypothetical protein